ncbi:MAG: HAD-IB family hydrolase [Actinobacteria bacterium]|nr:MAG: HAD-IB family hydrolase [Actinomycetota bacterium]
MEAAFFDVDKTVIAKASMAVFGRTLYREGLISRRTVLRGLWAQLVYLHLGAGEEKLARIRESVLTLTRGWDQATVRQIVREAMEELVEPVIYGEALELIETHRAAGRKVYIVSASPEEIVGPLASYLRVDGAISSRAKIDQEGRYTGEMEFYAYGPYKADAIGALAGRENIDLAASYAYSDSYTDLPMLEVVGNPVVVNPDRVLLKLARERQWEVRNFVRPVSLRPRVSAPGLPAAAVAGAVVMGVGGVVGWRLGLRLRRQPVSLPAASWQQRLRERSAQPISAVSSWLPNLPAGWLPH